MDEPSAQTDAERELAARRRDLERDFDDKVRDLKSQVKRQQDKLQSDREEWERGRKAQQADLADRTEKLRRAEDNHKRDLEALRATRRELEATKETVKEQAGVKAEAREAAGDRERMAARLAKADGLLVGFAVLCLAGAAALLVSSWLWSRRTTMVVAGAVFVLALVLEWKRRGAARAP